MRGIFDMHQQTPRSAPHRRVSRFAVVLTVLALLASSCGQTPGAAPDQLASSDAETTEASGEVVTLTFWGWEGAIGQSVVEQFELENPDIDIELTLSSFDQHHEGLASVIDGDLDVPDVAAIEVAYLPGFLANPEQFTDLRRWDADDLAGDYLDWRWQQGVGPNGEVVGLPTDVGGLAFAYRRDLFEAAGLPSDPAELAPLMETWDDFLALGAEFVENSDGDVFFMDTVDSIYHALLGQEPIVYADENGEPLLEQSPGLRATWQVASAAIDADLVSETTQFSPEWNEAMANGGFASLTAPSWMRGVINSNAGGTPGIWGLVPVPEGGGNWGGSQLVVPAGAEHPEQAWRFIRYLTGVEGQLALFQQHGNFPSTPELYSNEEITGLEDPFFGDVAVGQLYIDSVISIPSRTVTEAERDLDRVFITALNQLLQGRHDSAEDAWASALEAAEAID